MKKREERGSVTLFVVVACLFIVMMLFFFWSSIENKKQAQNREINQITKSYEQNQQDMERIYSRIEKNN